MFELHPQLQQDSILLGYFDLSQVRLINDSHYPWFLLVPQRNGIKEAYELSEPDQLCLHRESMELSRGLMRLWQGDKLNVAALGNMVPQLHVHHVVRFAGDAAWPAPIWGAVPMQAYSDNELEALKTRFDQYKTANYKGINTYESLKNVLSHVKQHHRNYQALLLTGDISQDGSVESYRHSKELFAFNKRPAFALPGNHDDLLNMREVYRGCGIECGHTSDLGSWQLILLNSQVPGEAHGRVSDADLNWLTFWLNHSNKPTLVAIHHHVIPLGSKWVNGIILENHQTLMDTLAAYPHVKAVTFGHVHQCVDRQYQHIRVLGSPSTCHQFKPRSEEFALDDLAPGYRWFDLKDDGKFETGVERLG